MRKFSKETIIASLGAIFGIILIIIGQNNTKIVAISCIIFAISLYFFAILIKRNKDNKLKNIDDNLNAIRQDIAINQENSQYYGTINERKLYKSINKMQKKDKMSLIAIYVFIGVMAFLGIYLLFI